MDIPEFGTLRVTIDGPVGQVELNRPERLNAITPAMLSELVDASRWFETRRDVRVVIFRGAGRAFCAGYDLDAFEDEPEDIVARRDQANLGGRMADAIERMRAITIARLHGWVVGGGVVLASVCDLRVASADTRFKIPEVELGIPLNWGGIPRLVREIGPAMTRELVLTCREFSSTEAKALGFLNRVADPGDLDGVTSELVQSIVTKPALPVLITKDQVNAVATAMAARIGYHMDGDGFLGVTSSPEFQEANRKYREDLERRRADG